MQLFRPALARRRGPCRNRITLAALIPRPSPRPLAAQTARRLRTAARRPAAATDLVRVALDTDRGRIVLALDRRHAPVTTANFLGYVDAALIRRRAFYRAMPYGDGGLIQGGISSDARKLCPPIAVETDRRPACTMSPGPIAMAACGAGHGPQPISSS